MPVLSRPVSEPCRLAGQRHKHTIPSVLTHNLNSLSSTNAGGIGGRFAKVLVLLSFLLLSHTIVCLQDLRLPDDRFISCLQTVFKEHKFLASAKDTNSGGIVTIYPRSLDDNYAVSHTVVDRGYIISSTFDHLHSDNTFTIINTYLHASSNDKWYNQVSALYRYSRKKNSILLGDLNYAPDARDRSGFHASRPKRCTELFNKFLAENNFEEIYQKNHTYYASKDDRLVSSRIDHAYHNLDMLSLANNCPRANVLTTAPYTVTVCNPRPSNSDWQDHEHDDDCDHVMDRQLVSSVTTVGNGGFHITDHLPLSIRFTVATDGPKRKFASSGLNHDSSKFQDCFNKVWGHTRTGDNWETDLMTLKAALCKASYDSKKCTGPVKQKNRDLWDAVKLVNDLDEGKVDVLDTYKHIPEYLNLANNVTSLVKKINLDFAAESYDGESHSPISRLQTIAKTLPNTRKKLTQLYDASTESITDDPTAMTQVALKFWKDKWKKKQVKDPTRLFKIYGKKNQGPTHPHHFGPCH